MPNAPLLIHIGYHKTGTTWLQEELFNRADYGFCRWTRDRKYVHRAFVPTSPFAAIPEDTLAELNQEQEVAVSRNCTFVISHERLSGYPPAGGVDQRTIADRLAAHFPDARILIVLREQASAIRSMYSQYISDGGDLPLRRFLFPPQPNLNRIPGFDFAFFCYDQLIEYYTSIFGKNNVLALPYELMQADQATFARRVCQHVGHAGIVSVRRTSTNLRRPLLMQAFQRQVNRRLTINQLSLCGHINVPGAWQAVAYLRPLFDRVTPTWLENRWEARIQRAVAGAIRDRYAGSNTRTSALLETDLSAYGYVCTVAQ